MIKQIIISVLSFLFFASGLFAQNIECIDNRIEIPLTGFKAGTIQWQFSTDLSIWSDIENQTTENLTFNIQETGYIRAQIIDNSCTYFSDTNYIQVFPYPTPSDAGSDININNDKLTVKLSANVPTVGTGYWSIVSGEGGSFVDSTDAGTVFSGQHCTDYTLRWTIATPCSTSTDDVVIGFHQEPTVAEAGPDQSYDDATTSVHLAGNIPEEGHGTGYWSVVLGEGGSFADSTDAGTVFTGQHCTDYTLRWTIETPCSNSSDDVAVSFNQVPTVANAGPDQSFDDGTLSVTLAANAPEEGHGTGYWSVVLGEGGSFVDSTDAKTVFNGQIVTSYLITWTISASCDISIDTVNINLYGDGLCDISGNKYKIVTIGNQTWMAENLKAVNYPDGSAIPFIKDSIAWTNLYNTDDAYCYYKNNSSSEYGALYTYAAALNVCPAGWHLPSDEDWIELENYLSLNGYNYDGTSLLGRDKIAKSLASKTGWNASSVIGAIGNNIDLNNSSSFNAFPVGRRNDYNGTFTPDGYGCHYWSSTESSATTAIIRILYSENAGFIYEGFYKTNGLSVRCIKD